MGLNNGSKAFNLPTVFNQGGGSLLSFIEPPPVGSGPPSVQSLALAFTNAYFFYADGPPSTIVPTTGDTLVSPNFVYVVWSLADCYDSDGPDDNGVYLLYFTVAGVEYVAVQM